MFSAAFIITSPKGLLHQGPPGHDRSNIDGAIVLRASFLHGRHARRAFHAMHTLRMRLIFPRLFIESSLRAAIISDDLGFSFELDARTVDIGGDD